MAVFTTPEASSRASGYRVAIHPLEATMNTISSEGDLDALRRAASAWAVMLAWAKHGLFDALAHGEPVRAEDLEANGDAVRNTAPILAHLGLLVRHPQPDGSTAWALSHSARSLMATGALPDKGAHAGFDDLCRLNTVLEHGGPIHDREGRSKITSGGVVESDPARTRAFMDMLYRRSEDSSRELARLLQPWVPSGHALDLGGGHGRYGHELAQNGLQVTLFDREICCDIANDRYGDRIATLSGDFMTDDLGGPYDLVIMSNIVHGLGPDELSTLLPRIRAALAPGGLLAIKDMFLDHTMARPESAALFGLTMLLYTSAGRSHTQFEMRHALERANFHDFDMVDLRDQRFTVLLAR